MSKENEVWKLACALGLPYLMISTGLWHPVQNIHLPFQLLCLAVLGYYSAPSLWAILNHQIHKLKHSYSTLSVLSEEEIAPAIEDKSQDLSSCPITREIELAAQSAGLCLNCSQLKSDCTC